MYDNSVNFLGSSWEYVSINSIRSHFFIVNVRGLGTLSRVKFIKDGGSTISGLNIEFSNNGGWMFLKVSAAKLSLIDIHDSSIFAILVLNWARSMDSDTFHHSTIDDLIDKFIEYRETGDEASLLTSTKN